MLLMRYATLLDLQVNGADPVLVFDPGDGGGDITVTLNAATAVGRGHYPTGARPSSSLDLGVWLASELSSALGSPGSFSWLVEKVGDVWKGRVKRNFPGSSDFVLKFSDLDTTLNPHLFGFRTAVNATTSGSTIEAPYSLWGTWYWPQSYLWRRRPERQVSVSEPQGGGSVVKAGGTRYVYDFAFSGVESPRLFTWDCEHADVYDKVTGLTQGDPNFSFEAAVWSQPDAQFYFHPVQTDDERTAVRLIGKEFLGDLNSAVTWYGGSPLVPVAELFAFKAVE